jgi:hypothetical protein
MIHVKSLREIKEKHLSVCQLNALMQEMHYHLPLHARIMVRWFISCIRCCREFVVALFGKGSMKKTFSFSSPGVVYIND